MNQAQPTIVLADSLFDSLADLEKDERLRVLTFISELRRGPKSAGMSLERIGRTKDLWSGRISQELRAILYRDGDTIAILHAGHHDPAYRWAERRDIGRHPVTGVFQIVETVETVREVERLIITEPAAPPLFAATTTTTSSRSASPPPGSPPSARRSPTPTSSSPSPSTSPLTSPIASSTSPTATSSPPRPRSLSIVPWSKGQTRAASSSSRTTISSGPPSTPPRSLDRLPPPHPAAPRHRHLHRPCQGHRLCRHRQDRRRPPSRPPPREGRQEGPTHHI
jgi:Txe/YoeB family toxin of Txe-Axe toxin-antitoxin module